MWQVVQVAEYCLLPQRLANPCCPVMSWQVGYGKDFQASRDIDNSVNNTFRWISNDLEEMVKRLTNPLRRFQVGKVGAAAYPFPPFGYCSDASKQAGMVETKT